MLNDETTPRASGAIVLATSYTLGLGVNTDGQYVRTSITVNVSSTARNCYL
jgi:hypothetical protein